MKCRARKGLRSRECKVHYVDILGRMMGTGFVESIERLKDCESQYKATAFSTLAMSDLLGRAMLLVH